MRPTTDLLRLARGADVATPADPETFLDGAIEHRLSGLLWSQVETGRLVLPTETRRRAAAAEIDVRAHHARLWSALGSLDAAMRSLGASPVALKGVTAEARWYDRMGERPCSDLDVWLTPDDLPRLAEVLELFDLDADVRRQVTDLVRRRELQHLDVRWDGVWVDLHFDPLKLGIWSRSSARMSADRATVVRDGTDIDVLRSEHALVAFLTHLNKDRFALLGAHVDIARLIDRDPVDWDEVRHVVDREGLEVPVFLSLQAVAEVMELRLPAELPRPDGWRAAAWHRLWPPEERLTGTAGRHRHPRRQVMIPTLARGRAREVLAEWRRQYLPPAELLDVQGVAVGEAYWRRVTSDRLRRAIDRRRRVASIEPTTR